MLSWWNARRGGGRGGWVTGVAVVFCGRKERREAWYIVVVVVVVVVACRMSGHTGQRSAYLTLPSLEHSGTEHTMAPFPAGQWSVSIYVHTNGLDVVLHSLATYDSRESSQNDVMHIHHYCTVKSKYLKKAVHMPGENKMGRARERDEVTSHRVTGTDRCQANPNRPRTRHANAE